MRIDRSHAEPIRWSGRWREAVTASNGRSIIFLPVTITVWGIKNPANGPSMSGTRTSRGRQGVDGPAFKMAFMACFNIDKFKMFVFESTFLSRFDVSPERIDKLTASDVELMKFGFDWIKLFLTGAGPLTLKVRKK